MHCLTNVGIFGVRTYLEDKKGSPPARKSRTIGESSFRGGKLAIKVSCRSVGTKRLPKKSDTDGLPIREVNGCYALAFRLSCKTN